MRSPAAPGQPWLSKSIFLKEFLIKKWSFGGGVGRRKKEEGEEEKEGEGEGEGEGEREREKERESEREREKERELSIDPAGSNKPQLAKRPVYLRV